MTNPFKSGDLAKCINEDKNRFMHLELNKIYIVIEPSFRDSYGECIRINSLASDPDYTYCYPIDLFEKVNKTPSGMVTCIHKGHFGLISKGCHYLVVATSKTHITILNNNGDEFSYPKELFVSATNQLEPVNESTTAGTLKALDTILKVNKNMTQPRKPNGQFAPKVTNPCGLHPVKLSKSTNNEVPATLRRGSLYHVVGLGICRYRDDTFDGNVVVSVHHKAIVVKRDRLRLASKEDVTAYLEDSKNQ